MSFPLIHQILFLDPLSIFDLKVSYHLRLEILPFEILSATSLAYQN